MFCLKALKPSLVTSGVVTSLRHYISVISQTVYTLTHKKRCVRASSIFMESFLFQKLDLLASPVVETCATQNNLVTAIKAHSPKWSYKVKQKLNIHSVH